MSWQGDAKVATEAKAKRNVHFDAPLNLADLPRLEIKTREN
jgi:hypothetical protein